MVFLTLLATILQAALAKHSGRGVKVMSVKPTNNDL